MAAHPTGGARPRLPGAQDTGRFGGAAIRIDAMTVDVKGVVVRAVGARAIVVKAIVVSAILMSAIGVGETGATGISAAVGRAWRAARR